jgi:hypothetical protein
MSLETLEMLAVAIGIIVVGICFLLRRDICWTWDDLHRLCAECEHELLEHMNDYRGCRHAAYGCHWCPCLTTRGKAYATSLTRFELEARKELRDV